MQILFFILQKSVDLIIYQLIVLALHVAPKPVNISLLTLFLSQDPALLIQIPE